MSLNDVIISLEQDDGIEPHNSKPITRLEVSPNGKYLVTYSEDDHSIVGWDVKDVDNEFKIEPAEISEGRLKPIAVQTVEINRKYKINQLRVSDDRKLVGIYILRSQEFFK